MRRKQRAKCRRERTEAEMEIICNHREREKQTLKVAKWWRTGQGGQRTTISSQTGSADLGNGGRQGSMHPG